MDSALHPPLDVNGVIFDMDGLMFNTEPLAKAAWKRAAAAFGFDLPDKMWSEIVGKRSQESREWLAGHLGPEAPADQIAILADQLFVEHIKEHGIEAKPGLREILDWLDKYAIPKAVATSTTSWFAQLKLKHGGIADRFDAIACGDEVGRGKPSPDVFLLAASRLGLLPARCLALEDSEIGVHAAHAAGMPVIRIPDGGPSGEVTSLAFAVVASLVEALELLERLRPHQVASKLLTKPPESSKA